MKYDEQTAMRARDLLAEGNSMTVPWCELTEEEKITLFEGYENLLKANNRMKIDLHLDSILEIDCDVSGLKDIVMNLKEMLKGEIH